MLNRLHPFCYKHNTVHSCVSVVIEFTTKYSLVANEVIIYLCSYTARELSQHQARCCWQNHQVYMLHGIRPAKSHSNSSLEYSSSQITLWVSYTLCPNSDVKQRVELQFSCQLWRRWRMESAARRRRHFSHYPFFSWQLHLPWESAVNHSRAH